MKKTSERTLQPRAPVPPIEMGARTRSQRSRAEMALRLLLRVIAVVWLVEGLQIWAGVLAGSGITYLPAASPLHVAGLFFFCILDFVAAVGLWLVADWGVAVWLATIGGHLLAVPLAPGFLAEPVLLVIGDLVAVAVYVAIAWSVARERRKA